MLDADTLRQELADLRARVKPPENMQDHLEQRQIEQRIRMLQSHLERTPNPEKGELK